MALGIRVAVVVLLVAGAFVAAAVPPSTGGTSGGSDDSGAAQGRAVSTCATPPCPEMTDPYTESQTPTPTPTMIDDPSQNSDLGPDSLRNTFDTVWAPVVAVFALLFTLLALRYGR